MIGVVRAAADDLLAVLRADGVDGFVGLTTATGWTPVVMPETGAEASGLLDGSVDAVAVHGPEDSLTVVDGADTLDLGPAAGRSELRAWADLATGLLGGEAEALAGVLGDRRKGLDVGGLWSLLGITELAGVRGLRWVCVHRGERDLARMAVRHHEDDVCLLPEVEGWQLRVALADVPHAEVEPVVVSRLAPPGSGPVLALWRRGPQLTVHTCRLAPQTLTADLTELLAARVSGTAHRLASPGWRATATDPTAAGLVQAVAEAHHRSIPAIDPDLTHPLEVLIAEGLLPHALLAALTGPEDAVLATAEQVTAEESQAALERLCHLAAARLEATTSPPPPASRRAPSHRRRS